jgi:hypothetical protein
MELVYSLFDQSCLHGEQVLPSYQYDTKKLAQDALFRIAVGVKLTSRLTHEPI